MFRRTISVGWAIAALCYSVAARAETAPEPKALNLGAVYNLDLVGVSHGAGGSGSDVLGKLLVSADLDLSQVSKWNGATAHVSGLAVHGGRPNDRVGALQGVDNIEVARRRVKLYEAWLDQSLAGGKVSLRGGLYDVNTEFDVTDSAGVFLAPAFGIATEIAATGPAGPSIFPSTALAARVQVRPAQDWTVRVAAVNAQAGTLGDPGGVDTHFDAGAILFAETAWTGRGKVAVGAWRYTKRQPDLREVDAAGEPRGARSQGVYLTAEQPLMGGGEDATGPKVTAFVRAGLSDGDTTPFRASGAVGVNAAGVVPGRPEGVLGVGFNWAEVSRKYRRNSADDGVPLGHRESTLELTYADQLGEHLTVQPDLQLVFRPGADPGARTAVVVGLRLTVTR